MTAVRTSSEGAADPIRWLQQWPAEGEPSFRIGRRGDELVAEWPGLATLRASRSGDWSDFTMAPGADPAIVGKFYRGVVRGLLGHIRGQLTLHGSAVIVAGGAVVLLGESGSGKSTTAADLCANAEASLVADDTTAIELRGPGAFVVPGDEVSWLTADALAALGRDGRTDRADRKNPLTPPRRAVATAPLVAMVKLVFDEHVDPAVASIARLDGHDAFTTLSLAAVRFVLDEPGTDLDDFDRIAKLAERVPLYVLRRPPNWAALEGTRDAVARLVQRHRSTASGEGT